MNKQILLRDNNQIRLLVKLQKIVEFKYAVSSQRCYFHSMQITGGREKIMQQIDTRWNKYNYFLNMVHIPCDK